MNKAKLISSLHQIKALADECLVSLGDSTAPRHVATRAGASSRALRPPSLDFAKPVNPFVKKYGRSLSGPEKFTLLLAWFAKGDLKKEVRLSEIQERWSRMTSKSLLGFEFNPYYPAEARNNDWVELKKRGIYNLRPSWKEIFENTDD
jgi:hypothetical protein